MKTTFLLVLAILTAVSARAQYDVYTTPKSSRSSSANSYPTYTLPAQSYNPSPDVQYNSGYIKQNGTVVNPYYKTKSDNTNWNNLGTEGNVNPFTSQPGTRAKDYTPEALNYGQGQTIHQGSRGGQYYINSNGNKVYVPKRSSPF